MGRESHGMKLHFVSALRIWVQQNRNNKCDRRRCAQSTGQVRQASSANGLGKSELAYERNRKVWYYDVPNVLGVAQASLA